jgi:methionine synthase II (cobalamin-independent)
MAPPFRAEHIGSLLRPADLLAKRKDEKLDLYVDNGSGELEAATQAAIDAVVKKQIESDIRPITTGEFERERFYSGFWENIEGFTKVRQPLPDGFRQGWPPTAFMTKAGIEFQDALIATGKIRRTQPLLMKTWAHLEHAVPADLLKDCKITLPTPVWQQGQLKKGAAYSPGVYSSDREYLSDLAAVYREEIRDLYDAGLRNVQIDAPPFACLLDPSCRQALKDDGVDPDEFLDLHIWAVNECLRDRPDGLHVGLHLCSNNMPGSYGISHGPYDYIAEKILQRLDVDTFLMEFADERAGAFEPLKFLPAGKNLVLGLVSSQRPKMEDLGALEAMVREAAAVVAKGQGRTPEEVMQDSLAVSSTCGYSPYAVGGGMFMSEPRMWSKLHLVRDLSRKIWKDAI